VEVIALLELTDFRLLRQPSLLLLRRAALRRDVASGILLLSKFVLLKSAATPTRFVENKSAPSFVQTKQIVLNHASNKLKKSARR